MSTRSFKLAKILGATGTIKAAALDSNAVGGGVKLAENDSADLGTGEAGDLKFASNRKTLHLYDGNEWDRIAGGADADPLIITDTTATLISANTTDSHRQTFKVLDPEGFPISYSISYMRDSDKVFFTNDSSNLPPPLAHPAIITKAADGTATYRFLTRTAESNGSGYTTKDVYKARYMGSDGARQVVSTKNFQLQFAFVSVARFLQSLPERLATSNLSGDITTSAFASGIDGSPSLNNDLKYTTIVDPVDGTKFNAIGISSYKRNTDGNATVSRTHTGGHHADHMQVPNANATYPNVESWIGTEDANLLIYDNYQTVRCCMAVIGNKTENYFMRPTGTAPLDVWSPVTSTAGSNWTQNNTAPRIKDAVDGTNFSTNRTNGPWSTNHYGPWCWNTGRSAPTESHLLKNSIMGNSVDAANDPIYIFERLNPAPYPPEDDLYTIIFYPDYPVS